MTDAQVTSMVEMAHARGCREFNRYDGSLFLMCQELLQSDPGNAKALSVLKELQVFIATREKPTSFDEFALPVPYTTEELRRQQ